jgi:hypothetical protein
MKRFSWLTAFACLLSSTSAVAQQYRPVDPRFDDQRAYPPAIESDRQPIRSVRYQEELQLGNSGGPWNPHPVNRSPDAADASRVVADQLRQQYHAITSSPYPQNPQAAGPTYYPREASAPKRSLDRAADRYPDRAPDRALDYAPDRPRSTAVEPARYSRSNPRFDEPQTGDVSVAPMEGRTAPPPVTPRPMMEPSYQDQGFSPYAPGCAPGQSGAADCYEEDYYGGRGGRFRARRGAEMGGYAEDRFYGPSDCADGSCDSEHASEGFDDRRWSGDRRMSPGSGGSRLGQFFSTCGRDVYTVVGARWLYMSRDGADFRELSYENPMPANRLLVSDADIGHQHGVEAFIVRQDDSGRGWEGRYWGLQSQTNSAILGNMPITQLGGLNLVTIGPWGNVGPLYNMADYHRIARSSEFHSFEWNLINHASVCSNNNWLYRGIFGLRVMRFRDALNYSAHSATNFGFDFNQLNYNILTRNTFVGAQAGGSGEYCVTNKLRLSAGANAGIGTNFMEADQVISNSNGVLGVVPGFGNYSVMNDANDLAVFGEFDARMYYHVNCNWRLSLGYRVLGLAGVALAQEQIPHTVSDLSYVKRDGGLLLHGLTMGAEFSY